MLNLFSHYYSFLQKLSPHIEFLSAWMAEFFLLRQGLFDIFLPFR